ncbi:hypothetical protein ESCO_001859 [Escovopsis weberi]|uniref:Uncharacterized protein n=1 Tax=Escovopsis weberi TaxID=150374 RepID=A0A0M8N0B2_ESCWE|nr:hypothetical protein ESCO_001859 [Escovopsis weberi]
MVKITHLALIALTQGDPNRDPVCLPHKHGPVSYHKYHHRSSRLILNLILDIDIDIDIDINLNLETHLRGPSVLRRIFVISAKLSRHHNSRAHRLLHPFLTRYRVRRIHDLLRTFLRYLRPSVILEVYGPDNTEHYSHETFCHIVAIIVLCCSRTHNTHIIRLAIV